MTTATAQQYKFATRAEEFAWWSKANRFADDGYERHFLLNPQSKGEELHLLDVTRSTTECGIQPLYLPEAEMTDGSGCLRRYVLIQITPREFARVKSGNLKLPRGWSLKDAVESNSKKGGRQ